MQRRELHRILASRGWLAEVEPALAAAVTDAGRLIEARRGEALYHPGDEPGGMYGVAEGGIVLSTFGRDGEPSLLLHVALGEFARLRAAFPSAGATFGQLATRGEALYLAIVTDLLISDTDCRIAAVLLRVTGAEALGRREDSPIEPAADPWAGPKGVPLTQGILAELANASRHTVARFVDRAVQAGWIDWRY
jgi:hypothetical protein